ncbi:histidyl-tRNA synthetase [Faunimonas pinastri]|uniref:Histidine--tRNA ligase n=1 Tax=Faunimonas pinastri TaxID=1855383 RepID=A0A1H8ZJ88_9HYPH|nr:histidine--tRNA ligase [Faunimonas pinastri]SEP64307.1 histidyl-tRNA synthetase [Faunimonas pinastri]
MAGQSKKQKLQPRLPRGFADRTPDDIRAVTRMTDAIRAVYERYGFEPVETPFVELTETLGKFLPDLDRPNEGVFSFQDDDEQWLSLRYDLTAPLARYVAENFEALPKPYRSYRFGWVFRNEKPGPGRFRQFMQFDADTVGAPSAAADAEICMMASDTLELLGVKRGDYVIRVNNRKVLDGVMEAIGLAGDEHAATRLTVLRAVDKMDRLGPEGVRLLLGAGRKDESGDFTKGAGLAPEQIEKLLSYVEAGQAADVTGHAAELLAGGHEVIELEGSHHELKLTENADTLKTLRSLFDNALYLEGIGELEQIAELIHAAGYEADRIRIDPSVVRGLEYYTGPVYEAELTFQVTNEKGEPVRFGSVAGGGRYDGLVGRFRSEDVPATGFSIGVSRLASALKALGKLGSEGATGPVVVTVMDRDRMGDYQRMVSELREAGIRAELYLGGSGMKAQLKYADRRNAPCVIIQGSQEAIEGKVQIKDLVEGKRLSETIADNQTWRAERPAQFDADRNTLVQAVRDLLARQTEG